MKIKSILSLLMLINGLLIGGMVYGDDPTKAANTSSTATEKGGGLGWQEKTQRTPTLITDGIRITAGPAISTTGVTLSIGLSSNFNIIDCCYPCSAKESWCNYNADDERCDN